MTNEIKVYEIDGTDVSMKSDGPKIIVKNHWSKRNAVDIVVDGKRYSVFARDLEAAIQNATNCSRF